MNIYTLVSALMTLAVIIAYINHRFIRMQPTIAIMSGSLLLSLLLIIVGQFGFKPLEIQIATLLNKIDFHELLINGMLSFLLFAGALTVDLNALKEQKWETGILASVSTIVSALLVGVLTYYLLGMLGVHMKLTYCLLFGALISPTDPIAVLATFKQLGAPKKLEVTVAGESLFNDGVGIVLFLSLYQVVFSGEPVTFGAVVELFFQQAVGGIGYGVILGVLALFLIKPIDDYKIEILITLAVVTGGYALAMALGISGPLAMVVAGIIIGNRGKDYSTTARTHKRIDDFWELIDEILNALLFLLIGFELLVIKTNSITLIVGILAIPLVLAVRYLTVALPISFFKRKRNYPPYFTSILVWGGLRGGLGVALALSLPASPHRNIILAMTYGVVLFAIIVQGSTVKRLVARSVRMQSQK